MWQRPHAQLSLYNATDRARTGDLHLEGHERICADMARPMALI
jgi:hypothetical protein